MRLILLLSLYLFQSMAVAEPGFFKLDDPKIPQKIRDAAKSVFELGVGDVGKAEPTFVRIKGNPELNSIRAKFISDWEGNEWGQLEYCIRKQVDFCNIYDGIARGSGFTIVNEKTIVTNLHVVAQVLADILLGAQVNAPNEINKTLKSYPLKLEVLNWMGNQAIYTPNGNIVALASFLNPNLQIINPKTDDFLNPKANVSDYVEISLSAPLASPLRIATKPILPGDRIYAIGFPGKTLDRASKGAQDSDGQSLYITVGNAVDIKQWIEISKFHHGKESADLIDGNLILGDLDVMEGMSGGPILNEDGEVVAVMKGSTRYYFEDSYHTHAIGVKIQTHDDFLKVWQRF